MAVPFTDPHWAQVRITNIEFFWQANCGRLDRPPESRVGTRDTKAIQHAFRGLSRCSATQERCPVESLPQDYVSGVHRLIQLGLLELRRSMLEESSPKLEAPSFGNSRTSESPNTRGITRPQINFPCSTSCTPISPGRSSSVLPTQVTR